MKEFKTITEKNSSTIENTTKICNDNKTLFDNSILLTTKEAAKYLRLSENALRLRVHRKEVTYYKLSKSSIRFKKSDLDKLLKSSLELSGENYGN